MEKEGVEMELSNIDRLTEAEMAEFKKKCIYGNTWIKLRHGREAILYGQ